MSETSYTPGTWFGIVGEHATVLLPPSEKTRAGAIWALVDGGAGFDEVLDALVSDGLRTLPGFVLVSETDDTTRVLVRGTVTARFETADGPVEVGGAGTATWADRSLRGVTRCSVDLGEESTTATSYVVTSGLVRLGGIEVPPLAVSEPVSEATPVAAAAPAVVPPIEPSDESPADLADDAPIDVPLAPALSLVPPVAVEAPEEPAAPLLGGDPLTDPLGSGPWEEPAAEAEESEGLSDAVSDDTGDDTDGESGAGQEDGDLIGEADEAPTDQFSAIPDEPGSSLFSPPPPPFGAPGMPPVPPVPAVGAPGFPPPPPPSAPSYDTPPPPPPFPAPVTDHDGMTRAGGPAAPDADAASESPAVTSYPVARLEFSSGQRVDVDRVVVVGRAPEAGRFAHSEQPLLVTVPSPHQEISSTHLEIRPGTGVDHGAAVATDLGSTNGTVLVQPGLGPEELRPGVPVQLIPGAMIDLGDGLQIRVLNP